MVKDQTFLSYVQGLDDPGLASKPVLHTDHLEVSRTGQFLSLYGFLHLVPPYPSDPTLNITLQRPDLSHYIPFMILPSQNLHLSNALLRFLDY